MSNVRMEAIRCAHACHFAGLGPLGCFGRPDHSGMVDVALK